MNDSVSSMRENAALMQQEINTSNQSYVDYADKLYQTTSENILTLQQHMEEAKETSNQAVTGFGKGSEEYYKQSESDGIGRFCSKASLYKSRKHGIYTGI